MSGDYDIVDESGNPTGQLVAKEIAHSERVPHRVVGMLLHDEQGRYVIQYRNPNQGIRYYDVSVGGHVDPDETPEQAVLREAYEELGIAFDLNSLEKMAENVPVDDFYPEVGVYARHFITWWHGQLPKGWKFIQNDEVQEIVWLTKDEIIALCKDFPHECTKGFVENIRAMGWL